MPISAKCPLLCILLILSSNLGALAQSEIDFKKMADLVVQVLDDQDKPIAGATIHPFAMRGAEGGGHGYWNVDLIGPPKTVVSDETGKAVIQYPVHIGSATEPLTTNSVSVQTRFGRTQTHDLAHSSPQDCPDRKGIGRNDIHG